MLALVQVELGQPQGGKDGQHQGEERHPSADLESHELVQDQGRQYAETDQVCEGIQLFPDIGISMQGPGCQAVTEITHRSGEHQQERLVRSSLQTNDHPEDSEEEIHRGDRIGNMLDKTHG